MKHFLDTVETIGDGLGFSLFGVQHIASLVLFVLLVVVSCRVYGAAGEEKRAFIRKLFAVLLLADELFKHVCLLVGGNFEWTYLPLHLCSINIFLITIHAWRPRNQVLGNFLYFVCIPAAIAALLFPTWTALPLLNFMTLHSTSVHYLLACYPIMLFSAGDIRPDIRALWRCLVLLCCMAVPIVGINLLLDTNFMFLMYAPEGNPLYWFAQHFGSHLIGFPVLLTLVCCVMYLPLRYQRARRARSAAR